jgi:hypothetical protein|tara:strand:- start:3506 stop:4174 length:669 start_codon:yes stop_codon:yes gene_type:complete
MEHEFSMRGRGFSKDLSKEDLYESVKTLVETEEEHIHLDQQKLFTLFSVAFQYLLFKSTKEPGAYILRIEDSALAEKLAKKSKDPSTRRFVQSLLLPRKLKYQKSTFFLDFFHIGSWSLTSDVPREKIKGAIIVKNTSGRPMTEIEMDEEESEENPMAHLPKDYFLTSLTEFVPKTITIAYEWEEGEHLPLKRVQFPFIKKEKERVAGLTLSRDIDLEKFED